jgi:hypothetical protein
MFYKELYDGEWLHIAKYLKSLERQESWTNQEFKNICQKLTVIFFKKVFYGSIQRKEMV